MQTQKPAPAAVVISTLSFMPQVVAAEEAQQLEPVNITATRIAQSADERLTAVEIITREDIERLQPKSIAELLIGTPGIDAGINGGYGKNSSLYLRGTNFNHTLLLVDGVRMGSATLGAPLWQYLPVEQIERIEVVRGPRSSLYGSEAIGGVIQVFTRKGEAGFHPMAKAGIGSYKSGELAAGLGGGNARTRYNLGISYFETEGIDAVVDSNPDEDGYDNTSINASFSHRLEGGQELSLSLLRSEGNNAYDDLPNPFLTGYRTDTLDNDYLAQAINATLQLPLTASWDSKILLGQAEDESEDFRNGISSSDFRTTRPQASWQNDFYIGDNHTLVAGLDFLRDEVSSDSTAYTEESRNNTGIFGQYLGELSNSSIEFSLRSDDNEAYGSHSTGSIAAGYRINKKVRGVVSYGTAFKSPTFNDLYWPSAGNPDLRPEESENLELGLIGSHHQIGWELRLFRNDIDNLIDWAPTASGIWQPSNINQARIDGLEGSVVMKFGDWRLNSALTLLDPRDKNSDKLLPRRAKQSLRVDLDRRIGNTTLGASWLAQGERYDDTANTVKLPGYGLLDLRVGYRINPRWSVDLQARNVFDKDYQTSGGYNSPGQTLFLSLLYRQ